MTDKKQEPAAAFPSPESVDLLHHAVTGNPVYDNARIRAAASALTGDAKALGISCEQLVIEVKTLCRTTLDPTKLPPEASADDFAGRIVSECIKLYYDPDGRI